LCHGKESSLLAYDEEARLRQAQYQEVADATDKKLDILASVTKGMRE
jgi:hypothetical protein